MIDNHNPYAPPVTVVADIVPGAGEAFQPIKIFGAKGRIGRMRYVAYMFCAYLILSVAAWLVMTMVSVVSADSSAPRQAMVVADIVIVIRTISRISAVIFFILIGIQRSHDMNLSGWAVLWTFIPFVVLGWMFAPGTKGVNRFGSSPPPNNGGVKIVFSISVFFMVLALIGIVTAIAAPAYQSYVQRIHAVQNQR
jgi:uncharacterized membrane protein YhaH (DUF805 family)